MTESEAKTKWCPMVNRAANYGNRDSDGYANDKCKCIGSACMMWQWGMEWPDSNSDGKIITHSLPIKSKTDGYCGLAAKL